MTDPYFIFMLDTNTIKTRRLVVVFECNWKAVFNRVIIGSSEHQVNLNSISDIKRIRAVQILR